MLVSFAILFGAISVSISAVLTYSAVIVATRAQKSMKSLSTDSVLEFRYENSANKMETVPSFVAAS